MGEIITEQKGGSACADARAASVSRTGQRRAAAAESVPVADVESKSLSENWEGSHCNRRFRVVRVFRGQNLLQFHFWSSPVTFCHVWSSFPRFCHPTGTPKQHSFRIYKPALSEGACSFPPFAPICGHEFCILNNRRPSGLKMKSGKEKVKKRSRSNALSSTYKSRVPSAGKVFAVLVCSNRFDSPLVIHHSLILNGGLSGSDFQVSSFQFQVFERWSSVPSSAPWPCPYHICVNLCSSVAKIEKQLCASSSANWISGYGVATR
jgi:hypothetical protein